jgi:hypothetical protein
MCFAHNPRIVAQCFSSGFCGWLCCHVFCHQFQTNLESPFWCNFDLMLFYLASMSTYLRCSDFERCLKDYVMETCQSDVVKSCPLVE